MSEASLEKFNLGDIVMVRGIVAPEMVVERIVNVRAADATGLPYGVHCIWFDSKDRLQCAAFHPALLRHLPCP